MPETLPPVVILSSIDWDTAWQRHQIFAAQFARRGHRVIFVENAGFRNPRISDLGRIWARLKRIAAPAAVGSANPIPANLTVISPKVLPPRGVFRGLNKALFLPRLAAQLREAGAGPDATLICYHATATTLELIRLLAPARVVYDCASNFRGHRDAPADMGALEDALLRRAALVVTDSDFLYRQKRAEHANVVQIHQGVPERFFAAKPADKAFRRFCYYGTWGPDTDPRYLLALADAGFDVTISGFLKSPPPPHPKITALGPVAPEKLIERLEGYDVLLMPYRLTEFTKGVVPAKLYECLAMGRPVIATPLPSLAPLAERGLLDLAEAPEDWVKLARELPRRETDASRERRVAAARDHTYEREFQRLVEAVWKS